MYKPCQHSANELFDLHEKLLTVNVWGIIVKQGVTQALFALDVCGRHTLKQQTNK